MFKLFNKNKNGKNNKSKELPTEFIQAMKDAPEDATIICCKFIYSSRDEYNNATLTNYKNEDRKIIGSMPRTVVYVPTAAKEKYFDTSSGYEGRFYFRDFMELLEDYNDAEEEHEDNKAENSTLEESPSDQNENTNNTVDKATEENYGASDSSTLDDTEIKGIGINPEPPFDR